MCKRYYSKHGEKDEAALNESFSRDLSLWTEAASRSRAQDALESMETPRGWDSSSKEFNCRVLRCETFFAGNSFLRFEKNLVQFDV